MRVLLFPLHTRPVIARLDWLRSPDGAWWWDGSHWRPGWRWDNSRACWFPVPPSPRTVTRDPSPQERTALWGVWMTYLVIVAGVIGFPSTLASASPPGYGSAPPDSVVAAAFAIWGLAPLAPLLLAGVLATLAFFDQPRRVDGQRDRTVIARVGICICVLVTYWFLLVLFASGG
jgi:hypothetical protein